MIKVKTNKDLYISKNLNDLMEFISKPFSDSVTIPAGTEFDVEDILIDRSDDTWGSSGTALYCSNDEYDILDYISLDDIEENC
ncbi:MAG: hypothetical protein J6K17_14420 [Oscillospiraceae bacterium]|nr:hypothetical protein [Oscillospiraceae bacterium]